MAGTSNATMNGTDEPKKVSVLFVCLGNICRSPMAEAVFRHLTHFGTAEQHPLIANIDSCGTGAYHAGDLSDSRTMSVLEDNGITDYEHPSRKVRVPQDFKDFEYILAMDEENQIDLKELVRIGKKKGVLGGEETFKVHLYGEFGGKRKNEEVGDPYYGGRNGFEVAYKQVTRFAKGLLAHIEAQAEKKPN